MTLRRWTVAALAVSSLLAGCQGEDGAAEDTAPATLTPVAGTDRFTVGLSADAADRLGVRTTGIRGVGGQGSAIPVGSRLVMPYAGVIYDAGGSTWTYVQTAANTFTRQRLRITSVVGSRAYLKSGPEEGTRVVVVGAPELFGAEYQIAGEE